MPHHGLVIFLLELQAAVREDFEGGQVPRLPVQVFAVLDPDAPAVGHRQHAAGGIQAEVAGADAARVDALDQGEQPGFFVEGRAGGSLSEMILESTGGPSRRQMPAIAATWLAADSAFHLKVVISYLKIRFG